MSFYKMKFIHTFLNYASPLQACLVKNPSKSTGIPLIHHF